MNRVSIRLFKDRLFTLISAASVILIVLFLAVILTPMLTRGGSAVFFKGTVEYRRMQHDIFKRGAESDLARELQAVAPFRQEAYTLLDRFKQGIDTDGLADRAKTIYRDYGDYLRFHNTDTETYAELRAKAKVWRDDLIAALESVDQEEIRGKLDGVLSHENDEIVKGTPLAELMGMARNYRQVAGGIDLTRREIYLENFKEVQEALGRLLGPRAEETASPLAQERYGATRWDMAQKEIYRIIYDEVWEPAAGSDQLHKRVVTRAETQFKGTALEPFFDLIETNSTRMLNPRPTFYWKYFIDDSTPGHYFGGVGPEILGTLMVALLAMVFAVPPGIISAAYLIECSNEDNRVIRLIRMCINTLAGVPSIVFGLFGLAFFVQFLLPRLGMEAHACILTAAMTLAVLVLPVIIRASEEAIKSVPKTYKEASLALGAGPFRTFMLVTLPAALPGILTGVILSLSRAAGETAPILFTGAVALGPLARSLTDPTRTLSYGSYDLAVGDRLAMLVPHNQYGMVITLILLVILLNLAAILIRSHLTKKLRGH